MLIRSAAELEGYSRSEEDRLEALIRGIAESGARVVVAGSAIGEMALHFVEKYGLMALRIPSKFDLRRFCRCGPACGPGLNPFEQPQRSVSWESCRRRQLSAGWCSLGCPGAALCPRCSLELILLQQRRIPVIMEQIIGTARWHCALLEGCRLHASSTLTLRRAACPDEGLHEAAPSLSSACPCRCMGAAGRLGRRRSSS